MRVPHVTPPDEDGGKAPGSDTNWGSLPAAGGGGGDGGAPTSSSPSGNGRHHAMKIANSKYGSRISSHSESTENNLHPQAQTRNTVAPPVQLHQAIHFRP